MSPRARSDDLIAVVEAGYRLGGSDEAWLRGVAAAARPFLDTGEGIAAYTFDLARPPVEWAEGLIVLGAPKDEEKREALATFEVLGRAELAWWHSGVPAPLDSISAVLRLRGRRLEDTPFAGLMLPRGYRDRVSLRTVEPGGRGVVFVAASRRPRRFGRATTRLWSRVAAHLAAARRLREALAGRADAATTEAILTPGGRMEHAEGPAKARGARDVLREAVLRQERARGRARREDPGAALEPWTALVSGRWSLVDRIERGGRRYLVARRNEVGVPDPRALSARERAIVHLAALGKSNKLIAYELGIASSTVATHLAAASRKLGVSSRVALIELVASLRSASGGR